MRFELIFAHTHRPIIQVDSHYCPHCLENMASAEAKMRKHRCGQCFDCPSCGHTLSTRATAVVRAKPEEPGKTMAQKAYYLTCSFCRWTTRDSGIPDQRHTSGGWQQSANPHTQRVSMCCCGVAVVFSFFRPFDHGVFLLGSRSPL